MVSGEVCNASFSPSPTPSHVGKLSRVWVHANTHGIARSDSTPPFGFRLAYFRCTTEFQSSQSVGANGYVYQALSLRQAAILPAVIQRSVLPARALAWHCESREQNALLHGRPLIPQEKGKSQMHATATRRQTHHHCQQMCKHEVAAISAIIPCDRQRKILRTSAPSSLSTLVLAQDCQIKSRMHAAKFVMPSCQRPKPQSQQMGECEQLPLHKLLCQYPSCKEVERSLCNWHLPIILRDHFTLLSDAKTALDRACCAQQHFPIR